MVVKYVQEVSDSKMNKRALGMAGEYCVVPENIHTPPPPSLRVTGIARGRGVKKRQIFKGEGGT